MVTRHSHKQNSVTWIWYYRRSTINCYTSNRGLSELWIDECLYAKSEMLSSVSLIVYIIEKIVHRTQHHLTKWLKTCDKTIIERNEIQMHSFIITRRLGSNFWLDCLEILYHFIGINLKRNRNSFNWKKRQRENTIRIYSSYFCCWWRRRKLGKFQTRHTEY